MVNRLEYLAVLRDDASPALRRLSETARNLNEAFSGAQTVGREFTRTLVDGIASIREGFARLTEGVNALFRLRLFTAIVGGVFALAVGALNTGLRSLTLTLTGLTLAFRVALQAVRVARSVIVVLGAATGELLGVIIRLTAATIAFAGNAIFNFLAGIVRTISFLGLFNRSVNTLHQSVLLLQAAMGGVLVVLRVLARPVTVLATGLAVLTVVFLLVREGSESLSRSFRQLGAGFPTTERLLDRLESAFYRLGVQLGELTARIIPAFVRGLLSRTFAALSRLASFISDVVIETFNALGRALGRLSGDEGTAAAVESTEELSEAITKASESTANFTRQTVRVTGAVANLGTRHLPRLIRRFNELVEPVTRAFRALRRFSNISLDTVVGQVQVSGNAITTLFAAAAQAASTGGAAAGSALVEGVRRIRTSGTEALLNLQEGLPSPIRPFFARLIADITDRDLNNQLTEAFNAFSLALSNPINLTAFLNEGIITEELQGAIDAYSEAQEEIVRIREAVLRRLGLLETSQEEKLAAQRRRATQQQLQSFLQSAGQLVQGRQELAIALATIDAGLAISGAFAHGAQYGPGYLAAYVATVAANLANTINSIRSFSVPSAVGAISTPDTGVPEPGRPSASPEVTVNVIGDRFSAQTVRDAVDESVRIATGQLSA